MLPDMKCPGPGHMDGLCGCWHLNAGPSGSEVHAASTVTHEVGWNGEVAISRHCVDKSQRGSDRSPISYRGSTLLPWV